MPSIVLERPRAGERSADRPAVVPRRRPVESNRSAELNRPVRLAAGSASSILVLPPARRPISFGTIGRVGMALGLVGIAVAILAMLLGSGQPFGGEPAVQPAVPAFTAYQGQAPEPVRFVLTGARNRVAAVPGARLMDWQEGQSKAAMRLTLGNPAAEPEVGQPARVGDGAESIRYRGAWPGVDAVIKARPNGVAYDLIVQPGADPGAIELEYVGATELVIEPDGRLRARTPAGGWVEGIPESWQDGPLGREKVSATFELRGGGRFGFVVGPYDLSRPLVIDPPVEPPGRLST